MQKDDGAKFASNRSAHLYPVGRAINPSASVLAVALHRPSVIDGAKPIWHRTAPVRASDGKPGRARDCRPKVGVPSASRPASPEIAPQFEGGDAACQEGEADDYAHDGSTDIVEHERRFAGC